MDTAKTETYGWIDAAPMHDAAYLHGPIRALIQAAGATHVLDAGCGNGALCTILAADGYDVIGVDADANGIDIARAADPKARFKVAFFKDEPPRSDAADGLFDCVVSTEVVEHLYSPHELPRFCFEALRPGGLFVISTPYHGYVKNMMLALTNKWDDHFTVGWHGGHIKFWSRATLGKLLTDAGFEITGFVGAGRFPYLWKSMIVTARKPG